MLADLIGEVVSSIVGDAIIGLFLPEALTSRSSPPEGESNASLGSVAAFLAGVAALFCGFSAFGVLQNVGEPFLWLFLGGSVVAAVLSAILAHRALEVTGRRRTLARMALWLSRATIVAGLLAALLAVAGVTVPVP